MVESAEAWFSAAEQVLSPTKKGERQRKTVRGSTITDEIVQINLKITEKPAAKALKLNLNSQQNKHNLAESMLKTYKLPELILS